MDEKVFDPEMYGMIACPSCDSREREATDGRKE